MVDNTSSENNKRIVKNTIMLYIRMFLIMCVTLYTSRVILEVLGIEDFGIYNIVGGIVILFSFLQNALTTATQRFLNYELGRNNLVELRKIFSASIIVYFFYLHSNTILCRNNRSVVYQKLFKPT